jgi:hypothetical protein
MSLAYTVSYELVVNKDKCSRRASMGFIAGVFLFVVVVGLVDRRLPWPSAKQQEEVSKW